MLVVSLKDQQLEVNNPAVFPFWPFHPNFDQYIDLFARTQFPRWALNTTLVAAISTLISLTFGTLAGYALARLRFRGATLLGVISFVTYLVPQTLLFIPLNIVITRLPVPLFLVTVVFSTVAVGVPLLLLLIPPEKRVGWGPLAGWLPGILLFGIGVVNRRAQGRVILTILLAWITTFPAGAALSAGLYGFFRTTGVDG